MNLSSGFTFTAFLFAQIFRHFLHNLSEQSSQVFYACVFRVSWCAGNAVSRFSHALTSLFGVFNSTS